MMIEDSNQTSEDVWMHIFGDYAGGSKYESEFDQLDRVFGLI